MILAIPLLIMIYRGIQQGMTQTGKVYPSLVPASLSPFAVKAILVNQDGWRAQQHGVYYKKNTINILPANRSAHDTVS